MAVNLLGVAIDTLTYREAVEAVESWWNGNKKRYIVTPNPEILVYAQRHPAYQEILQQADLKIPDGVGLIVAGKLLGEQFPSRVTGTDLAEQLVISAARNGKSVFFLGGRNGVARRSAELFKRQYPDLLVAGTFEGNSDSIHDAETRKQIGKRPIDLLLVAYGFPKQEEWVMRNLPHLNVKVAMGIGGAFDFWSGEVKRAPGLWRSVGLEWLYRLVREPWRWRRQLALPQFVALVLSQRLGL